MKNCDIDIKLKSRNSYDGDKMYMYRYIKYRGVVTLTYVLLPLKYRILKEMKNCDIDIKLESRIHTTAIKCTCTGTSNIAVIVKRT